MKNDLRVMKWNLYDIGKMASLERFKGLTRIQAEKGFSTRKLKQERVALQEQKETIFFQVIAGFSIM